MLRNDRDYGGGLLCYRSRTTISLSQFNSSHCSDRRLKTRCIPYELFISYYFGSLRLRADSKNINLSLFSLRL